MPFKGITNTSKETTDALTFSITKKPLASEP